MDCGSSWIAAATNLKVAAAISAAVGFEAPQYKPFYTVPEKHWFKTETGLQVDKLAPVGNGHEMN